ncbi:hypothetical protein FNV43_RR18441 [Rhamnella rubrinervis]|uniref:Uncharacterized protein n=1 Tax=Rhamnella rubrinervis TaxID=2594499 RepID=A0A8K0DZ11_9ROSA|nr:hypothetical protein FNV43_RR18441 [Rhamnella rubrinervis]
MQSNLIFVQVNKLIEQASIAFNGILDTLMVNLLTRLLWFNGFHRLLSFMFELMDANSMKLWHQLVGQYEEGKSSPSGRPLYGLLQVGLFMDCFREGFLFVILRLMLFNPHSFAIQGCKLDLPTSKEVMPGARSGWILEVIPIPGFSEKVLVGGAGPSHESPSKPYNEESDLVTKGLSVIASTPINWSLFLIKPGHSIALLCIGHPGPPLRHLILISLLSMVQYLSNILLLAGDSYCSTPFTSVAKEHSFIWASFMTPYKVLKGGFDLLFEVRPSFHLSSTYKLSYQHTLGVVPLMVTHGMGSLWILSLSPTLSLGRVTQIGCKMWSKEEVRFANIRSIVHALLKVHVVEIELFNGRRAKPQGYDECGN